MDLYQDCSYDAPGVKTGLAPGVTSSKYRNKNGKLQNSSFLKLEGAEVWYLVCSIPYNDSSYYDALKVKTGPAAGVTSSKHRNKQGKLQNSSSLKPESTELSYLVYVASPSGPLPRLFIWCPWGENWPRPGGGGGSQVWNIGTKKESFKMFLLWN